MDDEQDILADPFEPVDLKKHPEADLSANAEKGAALGGVAGAATGAVIGSTLGPAGAAIGAVVGGAIGAATLSVTTAALDTQGEEAHRPEIEAETDRAIEENSLEDDSGLQTARSWVSNDGI